MKIVINVCHGGFSLNREAFLRLREMGCDAALKEADVGECWEDGSGPRTSMGGMDSFCRDIPRDDAHLLALIEEWGTSRVNGWCAGLKVVEVPDGVKWRIEEYDGWEHVAEEHRTWG